MTRRWRLTPQAETSLADIADWTLRTFGPARTEAYASELIARCSAIAAGTAQTRDCSALVPGARGLSFTRAGRHFVIFTTIGDEVVILDFVHGRTDLPRRLRALRRPRT